MAEATQVASTLVSLHFEVAAPFLWRSVATCAHSVSTTLTQTAPGVLNPVVWVSNIVRQYELVVGCGCPQQPPTLNASVTFQLPTSAVPPGQQRNIPQLSATIQPPATNFFYGPGLTCARMGAYGVQAKVQLAKGVAQGARGLGLLVISGAPVVTIPMVDEGGKATATISALLIWPPINPWPSATRTRLRPARTSRSPRSP
jgi:hypothetical protein